MWKLLLIHNNSDITGFLLANYSRMNSPFLESLGGQLNNNSIIYPDPRQAFIFALNIILSVSPAEEINCNPNPGPFITIKYYLSISRNHLHILASEICTIPNLIHILPYSFALYICLSLNNALPSLKIAVYSINIDGRKELARNISLRVLDGCGLEFRLLIIVYLTFRDVVLEVRTLTPIEAKEGLFWQYCWIYC